MSARFERHVSTLPPFSVKQWDSTFANNKRPCEPDSWLKGLESIGHNAYTDDTIKLFMEDYEGRPNRKVREVVSFVGDASLSSPPKGPQHRRRAWLDDTYDEDSDDSLLAASSSDTPKLRICRQYEDYFNAFELREKLSEKRYKHDSLCDAHRRLIFVPDLDPFYVVAIVDTAPEHMVRPLRDAFSNHISLQTVMRVNIDGAALSTFCLQFHIPYYAWREVAAGPTRPHRKVNNLEFLTNKSTTASIFEAHVSIVIIGTGNRRWTALCFADTYFDPDQEPGPDQFSYEPDAVMDDPIFTSGDKDANKPIWDARMYFIRAVRDWIKRIFEEWEIIDSQVAVGIEDIEELHHSLCGPLKASRHLDKNLIAAMDRIRRTGQLVGNFSKVLAKTCAAWDRFAAPDGDWQYFFYPNWPSLMEEDIIQKSLCDIKDTFKDLLSLQESLNSYSQTCERLHRVAAELYNLQATREGNDAVQRNGSAAQTTILAVAPATVVSAIFAIPADVMSFSRNRTSFFLSILIVTVILQLLRILLDTEIRDIPWGHFPAYWKRIATERTGIGTFVTAYCNGVMPRRRPRRTDTVDTAVTLVPDSISLQEVVIV